MTAQKKIEKIDINKAYNDALHSMKAAKFNKVNPHFKAKYADFKSVKEASLDALASHGFAIRQSAIYKDGQSLLTTDVVHNNGDVVNSCILPLNLVGDPQKFGSELTYKKRYSWSLVCGLIADEDNDGNEAAKQTVWNGPLTKTELKKKLREFSTDLNSVEDSGSLNELSRQAQELMDQAEDDLPDWFERLQEVREAAILRTAD